MILPCLFPNCKVFLRIVSPVRGDICSRLNIVSLNSASISGRSSSKLGYVVDPPITTIHSRIQNWHNPKPLISYSTSCWATWSFLFLPHNIFPILAYSSYSSHQHEPAIRTQRTESRHTLLREGHPRRPTWRWRLPTNSNQSPLGQSRERCLHRSSNQAQEQPRVWLGRINLAGWILYLRWFREFHIWIGTNSTQELKTGPALSPLFQITINKTNAKKKYLVSDPWSQISAHGTFTDYTWIVLVEWWRYEGSVLHRWR